MSDQGDISLKVMRISRPILHQESPIYTDEDENLEFNSNYSGLSNSLLIPNSVGDFYLGEPANFMVTVQVKIQKIQSSTKTLVKNNIRIKIKLVWKIFELLF